MKRTKTLLILCVILVIAIVAIFIEKAVKQHIDTVNIIDEEVFSISEDDITKVDIVYGEDEVTLENADDTWTYSEDEEFPVDQDYVADFLTNFDSVHASFIIDDVEDYGQYGLDDPEATITFTTADGESVITFGTFSTIDEKRYICVDGGSVYLIDEDILAYVSATIEDYLLRDSVYDYSQLTALTVSGEGSVQVEYDPDGQYTYTDEYNYYEVSGDEHLALSDDKVESYLSDLTSLDLSEYETYKATEDDLAEYGLDAPTLTIVMTGEVPADDADESGEDSVESKSQTIYLSKEEDAEYAYLYFEGSTIVYAIMSQDYDELAEASYETLRPDEIVAIDWTNVSQVSTTIDDETSIIEVVYDEDDGNTYSLNEEELSFVTVTSKLDGLTLSEVGDDYEKGTQELAVSITLNDEDATVVDVVFYQYDGDSCVVSVDGKIVGLCSRSSMSTLREEITSSILNAGKEVEDEEDVEEDYEW